MANTSSLFKFRRSWAPKSRRMSSRAQKRRKTELAGSGDVRSHTATFSLAEITGNHTETPIVTFVDRVSGDNLRSYREEVAVAPPSPVKRHRAGQYIPAPIPPEPDVDNTTDRYQMGFDLDDFGMDPPPPDPKQTARSKPSVSTFIFHFTTGFFGGWLIFTFLANRMPRWRAFGVSATAISAISSVAMAVYGVREQSSAQAVKRPPWSPTSTGASRAMVTRCSAATAWSRPTVTTLCIVLR